MKKVFAKTIYASLIVMLPLSVIHIGCSSRSLDQNQQNILEQPQENASEQRQKTVTSAKPKETSIFSVIEIEDVEYPTLTVSIHLPFGVRPNNTVCLAEKHAYLTTKRHLHVIDVSIPQRPSYLTSLAFPDEIGKVLAFGDYLVVASRKKFYLVNVSQPLHPVLESTEHLPQQHPIKDFDALDDHLYVMGENDYLYIFYAPRGQARLVKSVELERRWWLLSLKTDSPEVEQIERKIFERIPSDILEPLSSQRGFIEIRSSKNQKVRASSNLLIVENIQNPMRATQGDLLIYSVIKKDDVEGQKFGSRFDHMFGKYHPKGNFAGKYELGNFNPRESDAHFNMEHYYVWAECLQYLVMKEKTILARGKPTISYAVRDGKVDQIEQDPSSEMIDVYDNKLAGPVTDFQIFGSLLYVVNEMGFFSIRSLTTLRNFYQGIDPQFISVTPLQASRPISLAVEKKFAYVLAISRDSQD